MKIEIKQPGREEPIATIVIAVIVSFNPTVQPKWFAKSPIIAVNMPITAIDDMNASHPPSAPRE